MINPNVALKNMATFYFRKYFDDLVLKPRLPGEIMFFFISPGLHDSLRTSASLS